MARKNFYQSVEIVELAAATADGTTTISSAGLPLDGDSEGVALWVTDIAAVTGNSAKVEVSYDDGSTWVDYDGGRYVDPANGAVLAMPPDGGSILADLNDPRGTEVRITVDRGGTSTTLGKIFGLKYSPRSLPVEQGAEVTATFFNNPHVVSS